MISAKRKRLAFATTLTTMALFAAVTPALSAHADEAGPGKVPQRSAEQTYSDPILAQVVDQVQAGKKVAKNVARVSKDRIRVEVLGGDLSAVVAAAGGTIIDKAPGLVLADIPADSVPALNATQGVQTIRLPLTYSIVPGTGDLAQWPGTAPAQGEAEKSSAPAAEEERDAADDAAEILGSATQGASGAKGVEAVTKTAVDAWHNAGFTGAGVKVGIIDTFDGPTWQAAAASGDLPAQPAGAMCRWNGADCSAEMWDVTEHGVGVAEIIHDMAPSAQLYVATAGNITDYRAVIDWFAANGVKVISRSLASPYDGPGNGQGPMDQQALDYAVSKGMAWFNSAGNSAGSAGANRSGGYFRTAWSDTNGDGWLNFPDGTQYQAYRCSQGGFMFLGVRWSDWGAVKTDYDVYIYDNPGDATPKRRFEANQSVAGVPPIEAANYSEPNCGAADNDYLAIRAKDASTAPGDIIEMMVNQTIFKFWNNPYSATQAASDSANPGSASIGAVDPALGTTIAPYSSWGPTNDGRMKPDMSGASNISSVAYPTGFNGTSAATPVVSGAAAVVLGREPGLTPDALVGRMKSYVADRGDAGPDNVYGTGELLLPPVSPVVVGGSAGYVSQAIFWPSARRLGKRLRATVSWKTSMPQSSAVIYRSLNGQRFKPVRQVSGAAQSAYVPMKLNKRNRYAITFKNAAGMQSPMRRLIKVKPKAIDDRSRKIKYARGWRKVRHKWSWKRTLMASNQPGRTARMRFRGLAVSVVMTKARNAGKARILVDGKSYRVINLRSKRVQPRRIVINLYGKRKGKHTIVVKPLTRGKRGYVFLDGFLVLR